MDSHHRHLVGVLLLIVILIGQQGHLREEIGERHLAIALLTTQVAKLGDTLQQLLHILLAADSLHRTVLEDRLHEPRFLDHHRCQLIGGKRRRQFRQPLDQFPESGQFLGRPAIDRQGVSNRVLKHLPKADGAVGSGCRHLGHRCLADATGGIIDNPLQRLLIVRVHQETEIGDHVFHLLALEE